MKNENIKDYNDFSSIYIYLDLFLKYMYVLNIVNVGLLEKCFVWYNMINYVLIL